MLKGRIKLYNNEKGFGFIYGEDNNEYFFHISDVKSICKILAGMVVKFESGEAIKGKCAKNIEVIEDNISNKPCFIELNNIRIKLNNIKSYGLYADTLYFVKVYEHDIPPTFKDWLFEGQKYGLKWKGEKLPLTKSSIEKYPTYYASDMYRINFFDEAKQEYIWTRNLLYRDKSNKITTYDSKDIYLSSEHLIKEKGIYLKIETYTKENFAFYEHFAGFDIKQKCKEIDEYMCK